MVGGFISTEVIMELVKIPDSFTNKSTCDLYTLVIGRALERLGKYDDAIVCYDEAIKIDRNYVEAWNYKGTALQNLEKYDEAIVCYDEAIKIDPNYAYAWYNKGNAYAWYNKLRYGKYHDAIVCYDEAIKIDRNYVDAWYNKGTALGRLGKYDEAMVCFDEAIKIHQGRRRTFRILRWLGMAIGYVRNLGLFFPFEILEKAGLIGSTLKYHITSAGCEMWWCITRIQ